jgi:hypothetical protein
MTGLISILNLLDVKNVACGNLHNEPVSGCVNAFSCYNADENNERPPIDVLGLELLQRGGRSPCSSFIQRNTQYSTPCDILAKEWSATFDVIQSRASCSIEIVSFGLPRTTMLGTIRQESINNRIILSYLALLSKAGVPKHDKKQSISASYEGTGDADIVKYGMAGVQRIQDRNCCDGAVLRMAAGRGTEEDRAGNERNNALHTRGGREDPIPGIKSIRNCEKSELISIFCGLDIKNGAGGA